MLTAAEMLQKLYDTVRDMQTPLKTLDEVNEGLEELGADLITSKEYPNWFGEFSMGMPAPGGGVLIEWPNLAIVMEEAKEVLGKS